MVILFLQPKITNHKASVGFAICAAYSISAFKPSICHKRGIPLPDWTDLQYKWTGQAITVYIQTMMITFLINVDSKNMNLTVYCI